MRGEHAWGKWWRRGRWLIPPAVVLVMLAMPSALRAADPAPAPAPVRRAESGALATPSVAGATVTATAAAPTPRPMVAPTATTATSALPAPTRQPAPTPPDATTAPPNAQPTPRLASTPLPAGVAVIGPQPHPYLPSRPAATANGTVNPLPPTRPAATIPAVYTATPITRPDVMRGMEYTSWWHGEYIAPDSDAALSQLVVPLGVNWIAPVVTCYSQTANSTTIDCTTNQTVTDDDIRHIVAAAHARGLKVMLKPHVDLHDGTYWRGQIGTGMTNANRTAWFASYKPMIVHYATLAQETGADYFVVGTELGCMSGAAANGPDCERMTDTLNCTAPDAAHYGYACKWRDIVSAVRGVYRGPITYAANAGEEIGVTWWDAVDAIGVDAYYGLSDAPDHPTMAQLKAAWQTHVQRLTGLVQSTGKSVIFTEAGYQSLTGTHTTPWYVDTSTAALNLQEQADCYAALYEVFRDFSWWKGVFWWSVLPTLTQGGPTNTDFTPIGKPAADVVRAYYGGPAPTVIRPAPAPATRPRG